MCSGKLGHEFDLLLIVVLNFWGRINWETCCIGLDKWWLLCAGCYGAPFLWLVAYGLSCKFMLTHFSFAY